MLPLTAEEAGRALLCGPLRTAVSGVSTDTRSLRPGDLFVALQGERFDGHDYVEAALSRGACGAVVEDRSWTLRAEASSVEARAPIYRVDDTLAALGALAREVRRKSGALVLAVTGSAGKTSTKDILGAMVARVRRVVVTAANENNEVGVPQTLLRIEPDTEAVVVEMGMRGCGQIAALTQVAEPDVGIVTNVYPVHLELLGSIENIAEAKAEIIAGLAAEGHGVAPFTCGPLEACLKRVCRPVVRFTVGTDPSCSGEGADVVARVEPGGGSDAQNLRIRWPGGEATLTIPAIPQHTLENLAAATAGCYAAGLPVVECLPGFLQSAPGKGRGEVMDLPGLRIIDDTYNANPAAVRAALDNLVRMAGLIGGRPVAVLGDMRELGPEERTFHRETGRYAASAGVGLLWGVGALSESTAEGFREACSSALGGESRCAQVGQVSSPAESLPVENSLRRGDVVLFKASRGVRLEEMVERIAEQARAGRWAGSTGERSSE